jgi:hypothetical protein
MINERKVIEKGAGLTNMSRGRGVASLAPERASGGSFGRLAQTLGVGIQAGAQRRQERADMEAMNAYKEVQHATAGKKPEEQRQALADARAKLDSGESLSFFDKLLTDESQTVRVWDKLRAKSLGKSRMAAADRFRAENQNLDEFEMKQGIANILNEGLAEAKGISEYAGNSYMEHSSAYIDNLDQTLTRQFVAKRQEEMTTLITQDTADDLNQALIDITGITPDTILEGATSLDAYEDLQGAMTGEGSDKVADSVLPILQQQVDNLVNSGVISKKQAHEKKLESLEAFVIRTGDPTLFDKVVSTPQKGSNMTMAKADPDAIQEARERVFNKLNKRKAFFNQVATDVDKAEQKSLATQADGYMSGLLSTVESSVGSPEHKVAITAFNKGIVELDEQADALLEAGKVNASLKVRDIANSYKNTGRGKEYFDDPGAVERSGLLLARIKNKGRMSPEILAELTTIGHYMSAEQWVKFQALDRDHITTSEFQSENSLKRTAEANKAREAYQKTQAEKAIDGYIRANNVPINESGVKDIWPNEEKFNYLYQTKYLELSNSLSKEEPSDAKDARIHREALESAKTTIIEELKVVHEDYKKRNENVEAEAAKIKNGGASVKNNNRLKAKEAKETKAKEVAESKKVREANSKVVQSQAKFLHSRGILNEDQIREFLKQNTSPSDTKHGDVADWKAQADAIVEAVSDLNMKERGSSTSVPSFGATF